MPRTARRRRRVKPLIAVAIWLAALALGWVAGHTYLGRGVGF